MSLPLNSAAPTTHTSSQNHQEDFCQALKRSADHKYQDEGGPTFIDARELIYACTPNPAREGEHLTCAFAFNWIIGNCDAHGKNYSLLYDCGAPSLAPLYDLVSTFVYRNLRPRLAMSINGATNLQDVDTNSWRTLAKHARVREAWMLDIVTELLAVAKDRSAALRLDPEHDNATAAEIDDRIQALQL